MISTLCVNVAAVEVCILSVEATPINPDPSPTKLVAVITPVTSRPPAWTVAMPEPLIWFDINVADVWTFVFPVCIAVASIQLSLHHYQQMMLRWQHH